MAWPQWEQLPEHNSGIFLRLEIGKNLAISVIDPETLFPHWLCAGIKCSAFVHPNILPQPFLLFLVNSYVAFKSPNESPSLQSFLLSIHLVPVFRAPTLYSTHLSHCIIALCCHFLVSLSASQD